MAKSGWDQRKHHSDRILKKRLKRIKLNWYWRGFINSNGDTIQHPIWVECVCHPDYNVYRNISTDSHVSYGKTKYSPNKGYRYRDYDVKSHSYGLREKDKILVRKIIKSELVNEY
jgi:hypothetical protein